MVTYTIGLVVWRSMAAIWWRSMTSGVTSLGVNRLMTKSRCSQASWTRAASTTSERTARRRSPVRWSQQYMQSLPAPKEYS